MNLRSRLLTGGVAALTFAAALAAAPALAQEENARVRVATATSTGTFYQNGIALEVMARELLPSVEIFSQASGGSGENTRLVRDGQVELFFGQNSTVIPAYEGTGEFEGDPNTSFSAIGAVWPSVTHVMVREGAGIESVADFVGKSIQIGPVGSGIERFTQQPMTAAGVSFDEVDGQRLGVSESVDLMRNGRLDGIIHAAIVPDRNAADLMTSGVAELIPFDGEAAAALMAEHPYYGEAVIPANSYDNQPEDVPTVASYAVLYVSNEVPEDAVYKITKAIYENQDFLIAQHSSFRDTTLDLALEGLGPVPLHPGAERYYEEAGIIQ